VQVVTLVSQNSSVNLGFFCSGRKKKQPHAAVIQIHFCQALVLFGLTGHLYSTIAPGLMHLMKGKLKALSCQGQDARVCRDSLKLQFNFEKADLTLTRA